MLAKGNHYDFVLQGAMYGEKKERFWGTTKMAKQSMHQEQFGHVTRIMRREKKKKRYKDRKQKSTCQTY